MHGDREAYSSLDVPLAHYKSFVLLLEQKVQGTLDKLFVPAPWGLQH